MSTLPVKYWGGLGDVAPSPTTWPSQFNYLNDLRVSLLCHAWDKSGKIAAQVVHTGTPLSCAAMQSLQWPKLPSTGTLVLDELEHPLYDARFYDYFYRVTRLRTFMMGDAGRLVRVTYDPTPVLGTADVNVYGCVPDPERWPWIVDNPKYRCAHLWYNNFQPQLLGDLYVCVPPRDIVASNSLVTDSVPSASPDACSPQDDGLVLTEVPY